MIKMYPCIICSMKDNQVKEFNSLKELKWHIKKYHKKKMVLK